MAFRVRIARGTAELDELFRLRHRVFVDEGRHLAAQADGRLSDRFDAYPTTANLVATVAGRVVGTVRAVRHSPAGHPTDEFYDFAGRLPADAVIGSMGMLCVQRASRRIPRVPAVLISLGWAWLVAGGATHLVAASNPRIEAMLNAFGAWRVDEPFVQPEKCLPTVPMVVTVPRIAGPCRELVRRHADPSLGQRQFHVAGEPIELAAGERLQLLHGSVAHDGGRDVALTDVDLLIQPAGTLAAVAA